MPNPAASAVISSFLRNQTSPSRACFQQLSARELRRVPRRRRSRRNRPASLDDQFAGDVEHGTIGDHVGSLRGERSCGENSLPRTPRLHRHRLDHPKYPCRPRRRPLLAEITSLKSGAFLMTTEFDVPSPGSEQVDGDATVQICDACGHARLAHDAIASRFCRASRDRALIATAPADRGSTADTKKRHADSTVERPEAPMYGRGRFSRT